MPTSALCDGDYCRICALPLIQIHHVLHSRRFITTTDTAQVKRSTENKHAEHTPSLGSYVAAPPRASDAQSVIAQRPHGQLSRPKLTLRIAFESAHRAAQLCSLSVELC